jgi:hypothetical protein
MTNCELVDDLLGNKWPNARPCLLHWLNTNSRLADTVYQYRRQFRDKFQSVLSSEDAMAELDIANLLLLDSRIELTPCSRERARTPEYEVRFEGKTSFIIEVKRVREGPLQDRLYKWYRLFAERLRAIPSQLAFGVEVTPHGSYEEFVVRLESHTNEMIEFCECLVKEQGTRLAPDIPVRFHLPHFEREIVLVLDKPSSKTDSSSTSHNGPTFRMLYTGKEPFKFSDTVFDKLGQMREHAINVLVITSNSTTHDATDLFESLWAIDGLVREGNDKFFCEKGFGGVVDFLQKSKRLSAIVFRKDGFVQPVGQEASKTRNSVWCNSYAHHQLPIAVKELLEHMDAPWRPWD